MAKQKGFLKIQGTLGDTLFLKTQDGYFAREKTTLSKNRVIAPRIKENIAEFSTTLKASRLIRKAMLTLLLFVKDRTRSRRLTSLLSQVVKADSVNMRGQRKVLTANLQKLVGFNFNETAEFGSTINADYTTTVDRLTGTVSASFAPFVPKRTIVPPPKATHFRIVAGAAEIDFDSGEMVRTSTESAVLPIDEVMVPALQLNTVLTPNTVRPIFLTLGIQFYMETNGFHYPLDDKSFNPLILVTANGV